MKPGSPKGEALGIGSSLRFAAGNTAVSTAGCPPRLGQALPLCERRAVCRTRRCGSTQMWARSCLSQHHHAHRQPCAAADSWECGLRKPLPTWEHRPANSTALQLQADGAASRLHQTHFQGMPFGYRSWTIKLRHLSAAAFPQSGGTATAPPTQPLIRSTCAN